MKLRHLVADLGRFVRLDLTYFLKGGFWLGTTQAIGLAIGILASAVLSSSLSREGFGEYQFVVATVALLGLCGLPGLNSATVQGVMKGYVGSVRRATKIRALFSLIGSLVLVGLSLYFKWWRANETWWVYLLLAPLFPLLSLGELSFSRLYANENFKSVCARQTMIIGVPLLAATLVVMLTQSLGATLLALFGVTAAVSFLFAVKELREKGKSDGELFNFGWHLSIINGVGHVQSQFDKLWVTYLLGFGAMAPYGIASAIADQVYALGKIVSSLIGIKVIRRPTVEAYRAVWTRIPQLILLFAIIATTGVVLAPFVIKLIYTNRYADAIIFAQALIGVNALKSVAVVLSKTIEAQRQTGTLYVVNSSYFVVEAVSLLLLVRPYGLWGAVIAQAISNVWNVLACLLLMVRKSRTAKA